MKNWYAIDTETVVNEQKTHTTSGLGEQEIGERQAQFGYNKFDEKKKESLFTAIVHQLRDVSVIVLLIAAGLSFAMALKDNHGFIEPLVIISIVIMNIILAITQERSAEKALEALAVLNSPNCYVIRSGVKQQIDTTDVVPGDIIVLKSGDLVPADARLLETESLEVDESSLTGESEPREKGTGVITTENAPLGDQTNMVFSGCLVVAGHGKAVVIGTGMNTEIGKIAGYLQHTKKQKTPLDNGIYLWHNENR